MLVIILMTAIRNDVRDGKSILCRRSLHRIQSMLVSPFVRVYFFGMMMLLFTNVLSMVEDASVAGYT